MKRTTIQIKDINSFNLHALSTGAFSSRRSCPARGGAGKEDSYVAVTKDLAERADLFGMNFCVTASPDSIIHPITSTMKTITRFSSSFINRIVTAARAANVVVLIPCFAGDESHEELYLTRFVVRPERRDRVTIVAVCWRRGRQRFHP